MAVKGCLQIIVCVASAFFVLYLLQNFSGKNSLKPSGNTQENFGGQEIHPSRYDVRPNQELSSKLNMPKQCGCQGPCNCMAQNTGCESPTQCNFTPPPPPNCNDSGEYPNSPTCPQEVVDQCGGYPSGQDLAQASCFPKSQLSPDELLPSDECNLWSKSNPNGSGSLADRNFLQAGWATGISTVGSTLRNANLQLRSEPPNPQVKISPWLQSTINPDFGRKPLELGGCA